MSDHIVLDAEVLRAQSIQMQKLSSEYSDLFNRVRKSLDQINNSFSSTMSSAFIVKINTAQKSFESIVQSMQNGAAAAMLGVEAFNEAGSVNMSAMLEEASEKSSIAEQIQIGGPGMRKALQGLLEKNGITGQKVIDIMDKIDSGDYSEFLKIYDGASGKLAKEIREILPLGDGFADKILGSTVEEGAKNVLYNIPRDMGEAFHMMLADDTTTADAAELYEKVLWHTGGSLGEGSANLITKTAFEIYPEAEEYWKSKGANTDSGASVLNHAFSETMSSLTGDKSWEETAGVYDNGVAEGMVGMIKDIGSFGVDKAKELFNGLGFHSVR